MSIGSVISYPTPLYQNWPIQSDFYKPSRFVISGVTLGQTTTVTTSVDHNYVIGQQVRLLIPAKFGCSQLNEAFGYILSIPSSTQVEIDIYSSGGNAFTSGTATTASPQILAIGDINVGATNSSGRTDLSTFVPGSFQNISPQ